MFVKSSSISFKNFYRPVERPLNTFEDLPLAYNSQSQEEEYDQIIKESLKELEQNQNEEKMFSEMLKDTLVQSK